MAFSPCGLIEAFYDPDVYNPQEGKFIVGLQFHPERMRHEKDNDVDGTHSAFETVFDYPGCARAYQVHISDWKQWGNEEGILACVLGLKV